MARTGSRTFAIVMRQQFVAKLTATVGVKFWNRELEPIFIQLLTTRWYRLQSIPGTDIYPLKLTTGHVIYFRIDYENDLVIPRDISFFG